jgi:hypothetical protein
MKKITVLMAMLALAMFAALPAFAQDYTIEVEEGDVEITTTSEIIGSIVQDCGASVEFGDENVSVQEFSDSQDAFIVVDGNGNEVALEQSAEQSSFSPSVETSCTQEIAQAASGLWGLWF